MAEEKTTDPIAQHADLFQELLDENKSYLDRQTEASKTPPQPSEPVKVAEPPKPVEQPGVVKPEEEKPEVIEPEVVEEPKPVKAPPKEDKETKRLKGSGFIYAPYSTGPLWSDVGKHFSGLFQNLSAPGLGLIDFAVDAGTSMLNRSGINAESINRQWDTLSRLQDPQARQIRKFSAVAIPSMFASYRIGMGLAATKLPFLTKFGIGAAGAASADAAIIAASDQGLEKEGIPTALAENFPQAFGPNGNMPMPSWLVHQDSDSPAATKLKNMLDQAGQSFVGDIIGFALASGPKLKWFIPNNDTAKAYKSAALIKTDSDTAIRISEIDQALATKPSSANRKVLQEERAKLIDQLEKNGSTDVSTKEPFEQYLETAEDSRRSQIDEVAILKLEADPAIIGKYVPEISPGLASPAELARQTIPPANVARNMADTAAIKMGKAVGDPAPIMSEQMIKNGLVVGQSRKAVQGLAQAAREAGDFDAVVDGFRMTGKQMDQAYDQIYADIIRAGDADEVRRIFADNRSAIPLADGTIINPLNPMQERAAGVAIHDLMDIYLGRDVTRTSARVMDTLGREIATLTEAQQQFRELVDDDRLQEVVLDKLEFLLQEHGINKYIAGWQLRNQGWFDRLRKSDVPGELAELINDEFDQALNAKHAGVKRFVDELRNLSKTDPEMVAPLFKAFSDSNGNVDTLVKYMKWAETQISPLGMIVSADPRKMNMFARTLWGVGMNNVLSIRSAFNALKGSTAKLILQPIEGFIGHGIEAAAEGSLEPLKRAMYYYGGGFETQKRALGDAITRAKKVNHDYDFLMEQIRADYKIEKSRDWDQLEAAATQWKKQGNIGKLFQYNWMKANQAAAETWWMRTAMTGMSGVDAYADTIQATQLSRLRAYDDVFSEAGEVTPELLEKAEAKHYSKMFNADGLLTDAAAKNASGEIALNLDDGVATYINQAIEAFPAAKPLFMFPKTAMNEIKQNLSYTPIAMIPGISKYGKILNAGDDIDLIKEAMAEHGVKNFDATPNAMAMYKRLQAEYRGRVVLGTAAAGTMYHYAMTGNIRGNGPVNAAERKMLRDNYGWEPKTINILGKWVSFKGIPMVDPMLTLVGDLAYYQNDIGQEMSEDLQDKLGWTLSATFINNTPLHGVEPFLAAMNGDQSAWDRLTANLIRTYIPQSGNLGAVASAIDSAQKDIYGDMMAYVQNRLPILSSSLPNQIDMWTGKPLNDIDNPILRIANAGSPIKVSGTAEPWRQWLLKSGFDGISRLRFSSEGGYEYDAPTRERLGQLIGEQQLWKKIDKMKDNKRFNDELNQVRALRRANLPSEEIKIQTEKLPVYRELNRIINEAKKEAEARLFEERPDIKEAIYGQKTVNELMQRGAVGEARQATKQTERFVRELRERGIR